MTNANPYLEGCKISSHSAKNKLALTSCYKLSFCVCLGCNHVIVLIPVPGSFLLGMLCIVVGSSAWPVFTSMATKNLYNNRFCVWKRECYIFFVEFVPSYISYDIIIHSCSRKN